MGWYVVPFSLVLPLSVPSGFGQAKAPYEGVAPAEDGHVVVGVMVVDADVRVTDDVCDAEDEAGVDEGIPVDEPVEDAFFEDLLDKAPPTPPPTAAPMIMAAARIAVIMKARLLRPQIRRGSFCPSAGGAYWGA